MHDHAHAPLLHIVLIHPEIPNNTGNIGRTAAALGCRLHVVHPIGFEMDEKARRRASLDYWHLVDCVEHASFEAFVHSEHLEPRDVETSDSEHEGATRAVRPQVWLFSSHASRPYFSATFSRGDYLVFGKESTGLDAATEEFFERRDTTDHRLKIPMPGSTAIRSLNLATAVAIASYEGYRQITRV